MLNSLPFIGSFIRNHPYWAAFIGISALALTIGAAITAMIFTGGLATIPFFAGAGLATAGATGAISALGVLTLGVAIEGIISFVVGTKKEGNESLPFVGEPPQKPSKETANPMATLVSEPAQENEVPAIKFAEPIVLHIQTTPESIDQFAKDFTQHLSPSGGAQNDAEIAQRSASENTPGQYNSTVLTRSLNNLKKGEDFLTIQQEVIAKIQQAEKNGSYLSPQDFDKIVQQIILTCCDHLFDENGRLKPSIENAVLDFLTASSVKIPPENSKKRNELLQKISVDLLSAMAFSAMPFPPENPTLYETSAISYITSLYQRYQDHLQKITPEVVSTKEKLQQHFQDFNSSKINNNSLDASAVVYWFDPSKATDIPKELVAKLYKQAETQIQAKASIPTLEREQDFNTPPLAPPT